MYILTALAFYSEKWQERNFRVKNYFDGSLEEHTYVNPNLCFWKSSSHFRILKSSYLCRTKTHFSQLYFKKQPSTLTRIIILYRWPLPLFLLQLSLSHPLRYKLKVHWPRENSNLLGSRMMSQERQTTFYSSSRVTLLHFAQLLGKTHKATTEALRNIAMRCCFAIPAVIEPWVSLPTSATWGWMKDT